MSLFLSIFATLFLPQPFMDVARAPKPKPKPKPEPAMSVATASWYDDSGTTASGRHYTYGFAALIFGSEWGTRVLFCARACVVGTLDDHGPYVSGRTFDLNEALHDATGCSDLCTVRWRVVH
jgi:hypothetical protein